MPVVEFGEIPERLSREFEKSTKEKWSVLVPPPEEEGVRDVQELPE